MTYVLKVDVQKRFKFFNANFEKVASENFIIYHKTLTSIFTTSEYRPLKSYVDHAVRTCHIPLLNIEYILYIDTSRIILL